MYSCLTLNHSISLKAGVGLAGVLALLAMTCCANAQNTAPHSSTAATANSAPTTQDCATGAVVNDKPHSIKLKWNPSASPQTMVKGYFIFRRESGPSCEKRDNACVNLNTGNPIIGTSCTDFAVQAGHTYIYQAQTAGSNKTVSVFSKEATATAR